MSSPIGIAYDYQTSMVTAFVISLCLLLAATISGCDSAEDEGSGGPGPDLVTYVLTADTNRASVLPGVTFSVEVVVTRSEPSNADTRILFGLRDENIGLPTTNMVLDLSQCYSGGTFLNLPAGEESVTCTLRIRILDDTPAGEYERWIEARPSDDAPDVYSRIDITVLEEPLSPGWNVVQEVTDVVTFRDLDCPSSSVCYAVGDAPGGGSSAYKTTDGGQSWSSLSLGVSGQAYAVQFIDEMNGFVGGFEAGSETNGYLLKTANGGSTWTDVAANMPADLAVRAVHFFSESSGYAGGGRNATSDTTKVMYTADGGTSWTRLAWDGSVNEEILRMYFWTQQEGYVSVDSNTGQSRIYYTTDGGATWTLSSGDSGWFTDVRGGLGVIGSSALFSAPQPGANWGTETIPGGFAESVTTQGSRIWVAGQNGGAFVAYKENGVWATDWNVTITEAQSLLDIEMFNNSEGIAIGRNFMARRIPE